MRFHELFPEVESFIDEARSNPALNPKTGILDILSEWKDREDVFISFTEINKLGINPSSPHRTPLGIYAYPLKAIWRKSIAKALKDLDGYVFPDMRGLVPYAGHQPLVQVFTADHPTIVSRLTQYKASHLRQDLEKLEALIARDYRQDIFEASLITGRRTATLAGRDNIPFAILYAVTEALTVRLRPQKSRPAFWTSLFRAIDINGIVDGQGHGLIHQSEPIQAVFFDRSVIQMIGAFENKMRLRDDIPAWAKRRAAISQ